MDWAPFAGLLALGGAAGFLAGLLGIGGGMLIVPFMTMILTARGFPLEHVVHAAIGTSLATILFTSLSSVRAHHRRGAVMWRVVRVLAPGILLGALVGAQIAGSLATTALALVFALFVGFSATQMILDRKPRPNRELPGAAGMFGVGTAIGAISSLVGAGGGFLSVPFMVWCNVRMHNAVATSAALGFPIAAAGTIGYVIAGMRHADLPAGSVGYIYVPGLVAVALTSVLLAPLGARAAHALDTRPLKRIFALMLYALAGYMLYKAARAM